MLSTPIAPKVAPIDDDMFDLFSPDPFGDILADDEAEGDRFVCPWHGPHEVDENGNCLPYCEVCERRL